MPDPATSPAKPATYPFTSPSSSQPAKVAAPTRPVDRPGPVHDQSAVVSREHKADAQGHVPDYSVALDYRTSAFSPVPMRVMDGSEDTETTPAAVLSGAPTELQARTVRYDLFRQPPLSIPFLTHFPPTTSARTILPNVYQLTTPSVRSIFQPSKTATQSGDWHGHHWRMDWDVMAKGHRWENPLMGWQSSADAMQGTHLEFKSRDDAIRFAEKQGYEFFVQEPRERKIVPKAYATQYIYSAKKLKEVRTK